MKKAFTLMEVLIVIGVLAILIGIATPRIKGFQEQAKIQKAKSELKTLESAITAYHMHNNSYPPTTEAVSETYLLNDTNPLIDRVLYDPFGDGTQEYNYLVDGDYWAVSSRGSDRVRNVPVFSSNRLLIAAGVDDLAQTNGVVATCAEGSYTDCGGSCKDLQNDAANCGTCGAAGGPDCCAGLPVDLQTDAVNCGSCGDPCGDGEACIAGTCEVECAATGGIETIVGGYKIHRFTTVGASTFEVTAGECEVDVLVVGGGGSGGWGRGGGGGAGGLIYSTSISVSGINTVTVGGGGVASTNVISGAGSNSVFLDLVAIGGGGGGKDFITTPNPGGPGGSGGGSGMRANDTVGTGGSGTADQGYDGGGCGGDWDERNTGGGGGAGSVGVSGWGTATKPDGGVGVVNSISGAEIYYAGGGGGADCTWDRSGAGAGAGGLGGGGNGGTNISGTGANGTANTGGGGGGGSYDGSHKYGGNGGSGIVIIRYAI